MIVDTHLHVIDLAALDYPWLDSVPALKDNFSYERYAVEALKCGITDTLHMEVDVAENRLEDEIAYVSGLQRQSGSLLRGQIASCRPEHDGFDAFLDRARAAGTVKGFRRCLHVMPDDHSESPRFRANVKALTGTGFTFDIVALPRQIDRMIELVDLCPGVTFILDHCGVPNLKDGDFAAWAKGISEIARRPNVHAKISGISIYGDGANWSVETLRPTVEHVISAFGWNRVVWGSDWPVVTLAGSLSTWVAATHALIAGASPDEKDALLWKNAKSLFRL